MFKLLSTLAALLLLITAHAQPSLKALEKKWKKDHKDKGAWHLKLTAPTRASIRFADGERPNKSKGKDWISDVLELRKGKDELKPKGNQNQDKAGIVVEKLRQYYLGVEVEHGTVHIASKDEKVLGMQVEFYAIPTDFDTRPVLSEVQALQHAMDHIGASEYAWQNGSTTQKPGGQLVIVEDYYKDTGTLHLAYRFDVAAAKPLSRSLVYVDARQGKILLVNPLIKHLNESGPDAVHEHQSAANGIAPPPLNVAASAATRYSGTRGVITDNSSAVADMPYRLRQTRNGHNIAVLNYGRKGYSAASTSGATDFTDNDNNWTTAEHSLNYDNAALDVHMAMEYISDYWAGIHGRNSWDGQGSAMYNYVHVRHPSYPNDGFDNAFWDGAAMFYGDGTYYSTDGLGNIVNSSGFKPLTSLDVTAHELGHAICQATADLVYRRESGALNEGFSDIWASCVEAYANLGKNPWLIGEELTGNGAGLRNMQNPKAYGYPDTYGGQNWWAVSLAGCTAPSSGVNDNCGVHINSSVLNKWFYLITQGGSATNDLGRRYAVSGLGFSKAQRIAYLTEINLTPNSEFKDAREVSILAATYLYGACSNEVIQVTNAWFGVGVGETASCLPVAEFITTATVVKEGAGLAGACADTHVPVQIKLAAAPNVPAQINFQFGGTAVQGVDYTVGQATVPFNGAGTAILDLYLKNDATQETDKTIAISFTVSSNGGNAAVGTNNPQHTITIVNDDAAPPAINATPITEVTLLSENFDSRAPGTSFPSGWSTGLFYSGGNSAVNVWAIGNKGGMGITGNAAYISRTATTTQDFAYDITSTTDRLLRLPALNTTGLKNIRFSFQYKVDGEYYNVGTSLAELWDYARLVYSPDGSNYYVLKNPATGEPYILFGGGNTVRKLDAVLPAEMENKSLAYIALRWTSDFADGSGIPLLVDDISVVATRSGASVETGTGKAQTATVLQGSAPSFIATDGGKNMIARITNASEQINCIEASLLQGGNGAVPVHLSGKPFLRTSKVISLKPAVPNNSATYQATLYFTTAELSGWTATEISGLKILKVKDGVDLAGPISSADAVLVTPVVDNQSANGYYTFTASFTGFSQFMLVEGSSVLPVQLLKFDVKPNTATISLNWQTESEQNNRGFWVERSSAGQPFVQLGWVPAGGGVSHRYQYTDPTALPGVQYTYRLRQEDLDGRFTYSPQRIAGIAGAVTQMHLAPNPAHGFTEITLPTGKGNVRVMLTDGRGAVVRQWTGLSGGVKHRLNLNGLAAGLYLVRAVNDEETWVQKLKID